MLQGGIGEHIIDFDEYALQPPSVYFLAPRRVHYYRLVESVTGHAILFTEEFLLVNQTDQQLVARLTFPDAGMHPPILRMTPAEVSDIDSLIANLYAEYRGDNAYRYSTLQAYLHILLVKFERMFTLKHETTYINEAHKHTLRFRQLVDKHFLSEHTVQFYANALGLSATYLATIVKEVTGQTPGQIIRGALALEAKRLLAHDTQSAEQISNVLNFSDPSYFGRFFKREVGVSPKTFLNQIKEMYQNT